MLNWLWGRKLETALNETKRVKVRGVWFKIKRLGVEHYVDGSKSLITVYDTYKTGAENSEQNLKKIKEHMAHVLCSGVVEPKLCHLETGDGFWVDKLFSDWEMVNSLYDKILEFTYGKKKLIRLDAREKNLSKLT